MDRAERRRRHRAETKGDTRLIGDGIVARALGAMYEANPGAQLPDKQPGEHRWICTAAWVMRPDDLGNLDADIPKYMDHENLFSLAVGCYDCEQPFGVIKVGSRCPAEAGP